MQTVLSIGYADIQDVYHNISSLNIKESYNLNRSE